MSETFDNFVTEHTQILSTEKNPNLKPIVQNTVNGNCLDGILVALDGTITQDTLQIVLKIN